MTGELEFTILGCGSSAGVPRADGTWGVCDPTNPRNRRSRCSLMVRRLNAVGPQTQTTLVVDASPEFRQQTAAAGARRLDALLLTHDHADQTHGLDDIRIFAINQRQKIACWMDDATGASMMRRFGYIFEGEGPYPAIAQIHRAPGFHQTWTIEGPSGPIPIETFDQDHGAIRSLGYRFGSVAYSSDVVAMPQASFDRLAGIDTWIVDSLRELPHPTHAHLDLALEWIARVKPRQAILTNMHIDLDYGDLERRLPRGVIPAFDGLRFRTSLPETKP